MDIRESVRKIFGRPDKTGSAIVSFSHYERQSANTGPNRGLRIGGGVRTVVKPIYLDHEGGLERTLQETIELKHAREATHFPFDDEPVDTCHP